MKKQFFLFLTLVLLFSCTGKLSERRTLPQPVKTQNGLVSGTICEDGNVLVFKGIPYAAPPISKLRWREPQPPVPWEGVLMADTFCASCIQTLARSRPPWTEEFMSQDTISEDCLCLNIWTPAGTPADKLPVLVFIHGGGFNEGSGSVTVYNGEELAKKGIIMVTINYRLGLMGFFTHPELTAESPNNASGNYGLLDQVAALQWIKNNIEAFGGDPECVTISGQSAGAISVHMLIASPLAKGLFHRAISQSGSFFSWSVKPTPLDEAEKAGSEFAESKGVNSLAELRAMPVEELTAVKPGERPRRFGMVIDGWFLEDEPLAVLTGGKQNDVPIITGLNADEGSAGPEYGKSTVEAFRTQAEMVYGDKAGEYLSLYSPQSDEEAGRMSIESARDQGRVSTFLWAEMRAKTSTTDAYTYYFSRAIPWPEYPNFKAFHTSEIPYVFNNLKMLDRPWEAVDTTVADIMSSYWVNFVTNGDPNGPGLPDWPAFDSTNKVTMELGENMNPMPFASEDNFQFFKDFITRDQ